MKKKTPEKRPLWLRQLEGIMTGYQKEGRIVQVAEEPITPTQSDWSSDRWLKVYIRVTRR